MLPPQSPQLTTTATLHLHSRVAMTIPTLTYTPLHATFVAEASGADFTNITPELAAAIKAGLAQYGVLVFRKTPLDDDRHVSLSRLLGELDDVTPYTRLGRVNRLKYEELFDVSNVDAEGGIIQPGSERYVLGKGEWQGSCCIVNQSLTTYR